MNDFPTTPEALTPERVTAYLQTSGHLSRGRVVEAKAVIIGTGKMGDNARVSLVYDDPPDEAPSTVVAKLPAADETARTMAGARGAYYNEVMFYRELAPRTSIRLPEIYASEISEDRASFLLLMEDLSPAEPGSQLVGESREHAGVALRELAKLAAAFYGDETLAGRDYLMGGGNNDGGKLGQALMVQHWPSFVDRFGRGLSQECIAFGGRYAESYAHFAARYTGPKTLIHGDFRSENLLFNDDMAATVDWQTIGQSSALADAAYFLGGSLEIEDRRAWERDLVETYRTHLDAAGVTLAARECWDQYREFSMHGLMITVLGASFSSPDPRSDRMFLTMIQRHLQHCVDLDAGEFL